MRIFISGGCKNGKSYYAQHLAKQQQNNNPLYYVATMKSSDKEDDERIARHIGEREGWGFTTIEQYHDIENILDVCNPNGSFLLDSLTALLANEMFSDKRPYNFKNISKGLTKILDTISNIVIVSDYIYNDGLIYEALTEEYRKGLANLDNLCTKHCDVVLEVSYTQIIAHKGVMVDALGKSVQSL